jgi:hypothetical protein
MILKNMLPKTRWVPHPFALSAKGWDSTLPKPLGL